MPIATDTQPKTSWADDVDELEQLKPNETVDENGIITIVEYSTNEAGKRVKITRRIKRTLQTSIVERAVAERKQWSKFGAEKGKKSGPDRATTTVGENIGLKISAGNKAAQEPEPEQKDELKAPTSGLKKIVCRFCKGDHFTSKCPHREAFESFGVAGGDGADDGTRTPHNEPAGPSTSSGTLGAGTGRYVPPGARNRGPGESMRTTGSRDDLPTLRVTNVTEDATEDDLRDLFSKFGRVARVYIGKDRETGIGKGFAFVSFDDRVAAQKAIDKVNGMGYDNLILSVQWSQPREPRA
jgi:translation initiation factor 3 subunit G